MLSVSRVFSFSPDPPPSRVRPSFSFENFNYMDGREKGDTRVVGGLDCQAQEPTTTTTTCRACRQANDFNSVPLSRHGPRVLSSSHRLVSFVVLPFPRLILIPPSSTPFAKLNLLRIGPVDEHRGIFKLSARAAIVFRRARMFHRKR